MYRRLRLYVLDADRATVLDQHAGRLRPGDDGEVRPRRRGMQIGRGRAAALAFFLRHLEKAASELRGAVEIRIERNSRLLRRLDEDVAQRIGVGPLGNVERPVAPMEIVAKALVVLRLLEERQHVLITPASIAELAPAIVIRRIAAHIDHGVDRA